MKLLFIGNVGYRFNSFIYSSAMAAKELGIEFHVAGAWTGYDNPQDKKEDEEKYGVIIHQIDFIRTPYDPRNIKAYKQVVELIMKEKIDIIHCNTPIGGVVGRLAGKKCGIKKVIYQAHGFHFYKGAPLINWMVYYPIERWLAHYTDALITINKEDYERGQRFHLRDNGKVFYVPGVGMEINEPQDPNGYLNIRKNKRAEIGVSDDDILLVSVGDINRNKNNIVVLKAIEEIDDRNIKYVVCGEGPLRKKLSMMMTDTRIQFLGYRTDITEILIAADIFMLPSLREGLSRSLMEAMRAGLPCIVSKIRGNIDLITSPEVLCKKYNWKEFKTAIERLISSEELRNKLGNINKEKINGYTTERVIEKTKQIYKLFI